ncbi:Ger(x)C family spore germination protein [Cohnella terricola]|uniref:Ger(X)C family spore germination protein n=1 Tax=Cohnella terricola TaxID=1289167 RepID=A0A559JPV8_9BACL|nr:Ger(x)C family spore germination protein [Cohnella terricola]TVY01926.1 Ger(x)C family spore germination protein [Cohnella terricola]
MIRLAYSLFGLLLLLLLSGCWNSKDIQNMDYATAVGIDYLNGQYITYIQLLNFANVGRNENVEIGKNVPIWVGKGVGRTISESLTSIYATSQMRIFWGHVKAVVFSESVLKKGIEDAYNSFYRFGEVRYNIYVYGTKENLHDIFIQKSVFNLSPLDTIMISPEETYSQRSFIVPLKGNRIIAQISEPGEPAIMPSISIAKDVWSEEKKGKSMLKINGAFFFKGQKMAAWLSEQELSGTRWTQRQLRRSLVQIPSGGPVVANLVLINPQYDVKSDVKDGKAVFDIRLKLDATLDELLKNVPIRFLEEQAENHVRDEIMESFRMGLNKQVDVLKLEETLYRNHPRKWHALRDNQPFILNGASIRSITVKVHLRNTGKYKGRVG